MRLLLLAIEFFALEALAFSGSYADVYFERPERQTQTAGDCAAYEQLMHGGAGFPRCRA